ncbi:hypothetical protein M0805_003965 [Coniferiporia weirii]|nr:hypothetical protein M0805_003965 [Coniferiporia weirii]
MPSPRLQLAAPENPLVSCSPPQLMPFHVAYSGPAPLATFFRVKTEAEDEKSQAPGGPSSSSSSSSSMSMLNPTTSTSDADAKEDTLAVNHPPKTRAGLGKRLIAAFRGRRIVGLEIPLPEGYTGVVLRTDAPGDARAKAQTRAKEKEKEKETKNAKTKARKPTARKTRRSKATEVTEEGEEEKTPQDGMELDDLDPSATLAAGTGEIRTLKPTQTFASLIVWSPDIAVDNGRDEYIRTLKEWTSLAAEVRLLPPMISTKPYMSSLFQLHKAEE